MASRGQLPPSFDRLLVEVFPLRNEAEAEALFIEINQVRWHPLPACAQPGML